jgi:hypothetical protein
VALQTAQAGVGFATVAGSTMVIIAAAGVQGVPVFGQAVGAVLLVAGLALLFAEHRLKKALEAVAVETKRFLLKTKVLLMCFDIADDLLIDLNGMRERVFRFALGDVDPKTKKALPRNNDIAQILSNEPALKALQQITKSGDPPAHKTKEEFDAAAREDEAAKGAYLQTMKGTFESEHMAAFKAFYKTPLAKTCMKIKGRMNDDGWKTLEGTDAEKAYCGYLKLSRYAGNLSMQLKLALKAQMDSASKVAHEYIQTASGMAATVSDGVDFTPYFTDMGVILDKIDAAWPAKKDETWSNGKAMRNVLWGLKKLNTGLKVANVALGLGAGVASIAGAENLARNAAHNAHQVTDAAGHVIGSTVTKTTALAHDANLAAHGVLASEEAFALKNGVELVSGAQKAVDAVFHAKATVDLVKNVADTATGLTEVTKMLRAAADVAT